MTDFPKMVFRKGGPYKGDYSVASAADAAEYEAMAAQGWSASKDVALGNVVKEIEEARAAVESISDEIRAALEKEAKELGVSFNSRTSDKVLAERVAEAR